MSSDIPVAKAVAFDSPADASYPTGGEYCETGMRNFLGGHNWPNGLQDAVISTVKKMPVRFVICDDSGSMMTSDGAKRDKGPDGADRSPTTFPSNELLHQSRFQCSISQDASLHEMG